MSGYEGSAVNMKGEIGMAINLKIGSGSFSEYAALIKEDRKGGAILLIMPFYTNYPALFKHLDSLTKQTFTGFDVVIVANAVSDEKRINDFIAKGKFPFGIAVVKRKEDTGSAGGYFTGEKYALEKGYQAVIIGDDDCLPMDDRLIEKMVAQWKGGFLAAGPECRFLMEDKVVYTNRALPFYNLIDISLLKKGGLHYLPAYIGADDIDFTLRVGKGVKISQVDSYVTHPARHSIFANFERSLLYRINQMLLTVPECFVDYMYDFAIICPIYLIFGSARAKAGAAHILESVLAHRYGKEALPKDAEYHENAPEKYDITVSPLKKGQGGYDYSEVRGGFGKLPGFSSMVRGKIVLLDMINNYAVLASMMLAKETWIASSKGTYLIAKNPGIVQDIAKICLFVLVLPFFLIGGVLTYLLNCLRKPDTRRYGLQ